LKYLQSTINICYSSDISSGMQICNMEKLTEKYFTELDCWKRAEKLYIQIDELVEDWDRQDLALELKSTVLDITCKIAAGHELSFFREEYFDKVLFSCTAVLNILYLAITLKEVEEKKAVELIEETATIRQLISTLGEILDEEEFIDGLEAAHAFDIEALKEEQNEKE
jgi:hypothetical protein